MYRDHKMIMFQKVMTAPYDNAVSIPVGGRLYLTYVEFDVTMIYISQNGGGRSLVIF